MIQPIFSEWKKFAFEKQKDLMRHYHVDSSIQITSAEDPLLEKILNPVNVAKHQFYPFIEFDQVTRRYKKQDEGRKIDVKTRPLSYAAHKDVLVYSWYAALLGHYYEIFLQNNPFGKSVIAYRRLSNNEGEGKSNIHFALEVITAIREMKTCTVLTFDVKDFFPSISHDELKLSWAKIIGESRLPDDHYAVFRSLTKYSIARLDDLRTYFNPKNKPLWSLGKRTLRICSSAEFHRFKKEKFDDGRTAVVHNEKKQGIPQGSSMSGLMSNISMIRFDESVFNKVTEAGGKYFRYSDDIAIILPEGADIQKIKSIVNEASKNLGLIIHPDKSEVISFTGTPESYITAQQSLSYLGFSFDGKVISLREKTISRFYRAMTYGVKSELLAARRYGRRVNLKKLFNRFSHFGARKARGNFLTYVQRAARITQDRSIAKQLSRSVPILKRKIEEPQNRMAPKK